MSHHHDVSHEPAWPVKEGEVLRTVWTIPNAICILRTFGSLFLLPLAWEQRPVPFLALYLALAVTDLLDGSLAVLLHQRSVVGPYLDSIGDVTLYTCVLFGSYWMKAEFLASEAAWIVVAVTSYVATVAISLVKFHRLPSYHTYAAKLSWVLVVIAVMTMFGDWSPWPFRLATVVVTLTNVETVILSLLLDHRCTDVPSIYHAWQAERQRRKDQSTNSTN